MTEHDASKLTVPHPDPAAELRHIVELVGQAEKVLIGAAGRLDRAGKPVGPPNPPPPPPWDELLQQLTKHLDVLATVVARTQGDVASLSQRTPRGGPGE